MKKMLVKALAALLVVCLSLALAPVALMEEAVETQEEAVENVVVEAAEEQGAESVGEEAVEDTTAKAAEEQEDEPTEGKEAEPAEELFSVDEEVVIDAVDEIVEEQPTELEDDGALSSYNMAELYEGGNLFAATETGGVEINSTNFPDEDFRAYILKVFDGDGNGVLSEDERLSVEEISLPYTWYDNSDDNWKRIEPTDLTGIVLFPNVKVIYFDDEHYDKKVEILDVSGCLNLQKLTCSWLGLYELDVSGCVNLRELDCGTNKKLTTLVLRGCYNLEKLDCDSNNLSSLDVSDNRKLTWLRCGSNNLTSLDVSNNRELIWLSCGSNNLSSLDVSNNRKLTWLRCYDNNLSSLDVSNNRELIELDCGSNNISSLDVSANTQLTELWCEKNILSELDVNNNAKLRYLGVYDNNLTALDVSKCPNLVDTLTVPSEDEDYMEYGSLSMDMVLRIDKDVAITPAPPKDEIIVCIDEAHFPDPYFCVFIKEWYDDNEDGYLSTSESKRVTEIDFGSDSFDMEGYELKMTNIKGIEYFPNLRRLVCPPNLTEFDGSGNPKLKELRFFFEGKLASINVSKNTALEKLRCGGNKLTTLDVSGCKALKYLYCHYNQLSSLDISNNKALEELQCDNNRITSLDVGNCPNIVKYINEESYEQYKNWDGKKLASYGYYDDEEDRRHVLLCDLNVKVTAEGSTVSQPGAGSQQTSDSDQTAVSAPAPVPAPAPAPAPVIPTIAAVKKAGKQTISAAPGSIYQLDLGGATGKKFKSSKKKVATVSGTGLVTVKAAGKTRITFKVGKKKRTVTLTVKDPTVPGSVTLNVPTTAVRKGDVITLTANLPAGTNSGIKWKSSNKKVATVSNGVVTFKKAGKVTITAMAVRGKKKAKVKFKVSK